MKYFKFMAVTSTVLCLFYTPLLFAQQSSAQSIEEITVTGRNREESLQEVPVSASVLNQTFLSDAGITDLYDLFSMVPGLQYDEQSDRLGAQPSVRGVQSSEVSTNRVKVSAFIDGMPVLGSQGSIGFNSFQQVEVYRGPQSAAFGRSTFAGAINYVTKDPGDSFAGNINIDANDYGTRTIAGSVGGPLTETLGVLVQFEHEDSGAPSEYKATGNAAENLTLGLGTNVNQSDGTQFGAQTGDNISAKFVFEPSDTFRAAATFGHVETHDSQNPALWLTEEERNDCFFGRGTTPVSGMQGIYLVGELNCDWDKTHASYANHDNVAYLQDNPHLLAYLLDAAINPQDVITTSMMVTTITPAGPPAVDRTINGTVYTPEEQILLMAQAYSIPEGDRGTKSERDRFTFQAEKLFDSGGALEFSFMHNEETQNRLQDSNVMYYDPDNISRQFVPEVPAIPAMGMSPAVPAVPAMAAFQPEIAEDGILTTDGLTIQWIGDPDGNLATNDGYWKRSSENGSRYVMASPVEIEENYAAVRWVSPGDERLRYVLGASFYDYDYLETSYGCNQGLPTCPYHSGVAYGALLNGIIPEFTDLTGIPFVADGGILSETATNTAAYFNVGYDLTDRLTLSVEGRYQTDKIGGVNVDTGLSKEVTTNSFLPRLAISYAASADATYYLQWSKGVNPAGINVDMLNPVYIQSITDGVANGLIPYNAVDAADVIDNTTGLASTGPLAPGDGLVDEYDTVTREYSLAGSTFPAPFDSETYQSYREEELTNIEFGFKGNLLDGALTYAGAIYMIDWKDQLQNGNIEWESPCADDSVAGFSPLTNPGVTGPCVYEGVDYFWVAQNENTSINGIGLNYGDIKIKGIELEGTYRLSQNWQIRGSASYLEAKYDNFCDIALENSGVASVPEYADTLGIVELVPTTGSTITSPCYVVDGKSVAGQPNFNGSLSPSYNTDLGNGMRFGARVDVRYEGSKWLESANWGRYPAVTTTNISFSLSRDAWAATLYVNNVTDENTPRTIRTSADADVLFVDSTTTLDVNGNPADLRSGNLTFSPRIPRTIGLRASYNF